VNQIPGNRVVMFAKSTDGGQTWQKTVVEDSPLWPEMARNNAALAFDTQNNPWVVWQFYDPWYLAYPYVARSLDGGDTFGEPFFKEDSFEMEVRSIAIDENNNVYIPWMRGLKCVTFLAGDPNDWTIGQVSPPTLSPNWHPVFCSKGRDTVYTAWSADSLDYTKPDLIFFSRSIDTGQYFSEALLLSLGPLEDTFGALFPSIAVAEENILYVAWPDPQTGDYDIYLTKSLDAGISFLPEKRINDVFEGNQTRVYMTYRPKLGLCVTYLDRGSGTEKSNYNATSFIKKTIQAGDIYFTKSTDGGDTFSESVLVTDSTFQQYGQWVWGIAADDSGNVYVVFTDDPYDKSIVFVSKATFDITSIPNGQLDIRIPETFCLSQNYPNPFNAQTTIEYSIPVESYVTLNIYNILGEKVRTLARASEPQGRYQVVWDGKNAAGDLVSSGVYLYKLETQHTAIVRKLVLLR